MTEQSGAELLAQNIEAQGVEYIFAIPGAKIDRVFDALIGKKPQVVVCRHEQNAALIAQGIGRMTGKAGVCLVTSGPGCSNLVTGLATATTEGDPVVAFGGAVPLADRLKQTHQTLDSVRLFKPVTKFSAEVDAPHAISEVVANAFRSAEAGRPGAAFISLPMDVMEGPAPYDVLTPVRIPRYGAGDTTALAEAACAINRAAFPVVLLGMMASQPEAAQAARAFLAKTRLPVVGTFQASGVVPRELLDCFGGRVGLFHNQPADRILDQADLVLTIGFDPVEYDPWLWNHQGLKRRLIHLDVSGADADMDYRPDIEIIGDIAASLKLLTGFVDARSFAAMRFSVQEATQALAAIKEKGAALSGAPVHPLRIVSELQNLVSDDMTVITDVGSLYIWMNRYFLSHNPRHFLASNGQQTLGVALPWAIAASLARPQHKVISMSGDGGFLFSAMELETAVRLNSNLVHIVWRDGAYDMVRFQQVAKYGRDTAVEFGPVDTVRYAEAFGARGYAVQCADEIAPVLKKALDADGPVLIDIPVDYRHNMHLMEQIHSGIIH
ncbi:acetolactate synthase AlsS [Candidatus Methylospira mobilis]|uniref:Acetolactate synthase AlsS n=1 Tax=Candidatus Methylospira mobilis TaxID=1808979 RepID=A0A5Q0BBA8_9GAMM|nr:acetolactate synthase AlsS [Candidatus Methylospira mobilis]QFY41205.1 acetolactate synthase AlsS [Candidatus Methylospira mobilis]